MLVFNFLDFFFLINFIDNTLALPSSSSFISWEIEAQGLFLALGKLLTFTLLTALDLKPEAQNSLQDAELNQTAPVSLCSGFYEFNSSFGHPFSVFIIEPSP